MPWFALFIFGPSLLPAFAVGWGIIFLAIALHSLSIGFHASLEATYFTVGGLVVAYRLRHAIRAALHPASHESLFAQYDDHTVRKVLLTVLLFWAAYQADAAWAHFIDWLPGPRPHASHVEIVFPPPSAPPAGDHQ